MNLSLSRRRKDAGKKGSKKGKVIKTKQCRHCRRRFVPDDARVKVNVCPYCKKLTGPKPTISQAKKAAWNAFARFIKARDADSAGMVTCITCKDRYHYQDKRMHAGHFLQGRTKGILFHPLCVHGQCFICNIKKHGNPDVFWPVMVETYGQELIDELLDLKHRAQGSWTVEELEEIESQYLERLESIEATFRHHTKGVCRETSVSQSRERTEM